MPYVDTTFLPKTNQLVFSERLVARADKGRVFGLGPTPPPNAQIVVDLTSPVDMVSGQRATFTVVASGVYNLQYTWQIRKANDTAWVTANATNLAAQYPDAVVTLLDPQGGTLQYTWVSGPSIIKLRCRVRDTNGEGEFDQVNSTVVTLNYP